jgi:hypothetical protein
MIIDLVWPNGVQEEPRFSSTPPSLEANVFEVICWRRIGRNWWREQSIAQDLRKG